MYISSQIFAGKADKWSEITAQ